MRLCQDTAYQEASAWDDPYGIGQVDPRIEHIPTCREIAEACAAIRSRWTPCEKRRRFVGAVVPDDDSLPWRPPVIDTLWLRSRAGSSTETA